MVRKGNYQARAPSSSQHSSQQRQQQRKGRSRNGSATLLTSPDQQINFACFSEQFVCEQPALPNPFPSPAVSPPDLGVALQRMGILPVLPSASERKLALPDQGQMACLRELNEFLDKSYELQQRGHQLWVAEQIELQRGAELCILSPPSACQQSTDPSRYMPHQTPTKNTQLLRRPIESPTDALLSPQTASALLAMATHSTCLSPGMTGSAAAQLLSPSAFGFAPLVLQDQTNYQRRNVSHGPCQPSFPPYASVAADVQAELQHSDNAQLMPADAQVYGHHAGKSLNTCFDVNVRTDLSAHEAWRASLARPQQLQFHSVQLSSANTPRGGDLLPSSLTQLSPLSPADLLLTAAGNRSTEACLDIGFFSSYGAQPSAHYDCDLHADLRLDTAGLTKRAKR